MRRRATVLALALAASGAGLAVAGSCTTFNGVVVPAADGSSSDTSPEATPVEAAPEASTAPGYVSLAEAARVCSLVFECPLLASSVLASLAVPVDPTNYSLCVHWLAAPVPPDRVGFAVQAQAFACMAQGGTCAGAGSCLSLENVASTDPRCSDAGADAGEHCAEDGGAVYRCAQGYLLHCGSAYYGPGSQCLVGQDGTHWCAIGQNCSVQPSCIGTLLEYCGQSNNLTESVNCSYDGYTCDVATNEDSGTPGCNTGHVVKACSSAGTSCSGDVVEVCDGYDDSEFDCAAVGGTCSAKAGPALCVHADDACSPFDSDVNVCSGSTLALCVGGKKEALDCASLGMTCIPGAGAESGHCG
jgi:hypothetical protein